MNIVVLMKQVPDTESELAINDDATGIDSEDVKMAINPYDEFAIEEALLIKEKDGGGTVTLVSVGPDTVPEAIRVAYAMGVDHAVHVNDEIDEGVYGGADAFTSAKIIVAALKDIDYDLIIAGNRAVDGDNYQVPAHVAEMLGLPLVSAVVHQEISGDAITCKKLIEGGTATVRTSLPAIITAQKGLNEPRYPAFRAIMKAKKKDFDELELDDLGIDEKSVGAAGAFIKIRKLELAPARTGGRIIEGASPAEKAAALVKLLREERQVI
ncbi:electron transfer flavoprotein subunit beta/FixA family protein [Desulforhopalus singaporensis]|uniref:Electron transfer flavoprotein subunit beta n=1 Tax=Desulforhopalus singaporensis TaxID=91360 RepID=A0A1H0KBN5_9BACT|nr:electron transfer flavoprotein subunit beta/FixA family protein [Desulforhopalus singaporensis]SDO53365.1 electron transfer flavoprotein beta subunit [Desulforhopalus singaporensis]